MIPRVASDLDKACKALAVPERRLLLDRLRAGNGQTLGQLCGDMDTARQAVARRFKLLEEARLGAIFWRGREKLHDLNPMPIREITDRWIGPFERGRLSTLSKL